MKKSIIILPVAILTLIILQFFDVSESSAQQPQSQKPPHQFTVNKEPSNPNALRIGVNLGYRTSWGTEQFMKNIVLNPGLEGDFTRFIAIVTTADDKSFSNNGWEQPDGFWKGADFEIRTGPNAGTKGKIKNSLKASEATGQPQYFSEEPLPHLEKDDVVVLTKEYISFQQPSQWTDRNYHKGIKMVKDHRPGSAGVNAAELTVLEKDNNSLISYIDNLGKYLKINGGWSLTFWAKSSVPQGKVSVTFKRLNGRAPFIQKDVMLSTEWEKYSLNFIGHDVGKEAILSFEFQPQGKPGDRVYIDDVWLGSREDNSPLTFRKEVVDLLKQLNPSYLRDWQVQFLDTFENRIATSDARQNSAPAGSDGKLYGYYWFYSLSEFLDLCEAIGANPWVIIPVTFSDEEFKEMGKYLAVNASKKRFSNVILEFGNENWNWGFRPGGIPYAEPYGKVFERAVEMMKPHLKDGNFTLAINGQLANPWLTGEYTKFAPSADLVGIAGYYVGRLDSTAAIKNAIAAFFSQNPDIKQTLNTVKAYKKPLAMYEINAGTVSGTMAEVQRNQLVSGAISGSFLAKQLLEALFLGIQPNMVFTFSQAYTSLTDIKEGKVNLWGITVDLSPTLRLRPSGLTVKMLNKVIAGEMYNVTREGNVPLEQLTIAAFKTEESWKIAAVLSNENSQEVEVKFPDDNNPLPKTIWVLDAKTPFDMNEDAENVKIKEIPTQTDGRSLIFTIPAYGFLIAF